MLHLVRSPWPGTRFVPQAAPAELRGLLKRLHEDPTRCLWIFPTGRLRRAVLREWFRSRPGSAALLPGLHTLESFVSWGLEFSLSQRPQLTAVERVFRMAQAWQAVTHRPAGPGLLSQLDRFVRDWQACCLSPGRQTRDVFERTVLDFQDAMRADERLDRMAGVAALTCELADPQSCPSRYLQQQDGLLVFDGFHRLEPIELELLAALSRRCEVLLWLVSTAGQASEATTDWAAQELERFGATIHHLTIPSAAGPQPFAGIGRTLFPKVQGRSQPQPAPSGLFVLRPRDLHAELEIVATAIKADYLEAQRRQAPMRLSDIAVLIPGPAYDPLVREVFPRFGLEFNLAGQAMALAASRPVRLLLAALEILRGQWRHDLLLDFLQHPAVVRQLPQSSLLQQLFDSRPRARRLLDAKFWFDAWERRLQQQRNQLESWEKGIQPLPGHVTLPREEFLAQQTLRLGETQELVAALVQFLQPLARMAAVLADPQEPQPLRRLVEECVALLRLVEFNHWVEPLTALHQQGGPAVPWVEFEKDQQAYAKLLDLLSELALLPPGTTPQKADGTPDPLTALYLALETESFQIKTEDDAGVQLFELREIRGLQFRHMYVLGLVDGQLPTIPEEGALVSRRRQHEALRRQLEQKDEETQYLFVQVFEAAQEKLVLSQPQLAEEQKTRPSPFLTAVLERTQPQEMERPWLVASLAVAGAALGRLQRLESETAPLPDRRLWENAHALQRIHHDLHVWRTRPQWPAAIRVDLPALLRVLFPDDRPFSASDLETYAACPFRYFGARLLRLAERDAEPGRQFYGSLVHRVFHRLYEELRASLKNGPGEPLPALDSQCRARLLEIFNEEWRSEDEGLLPPESHRLFTHDQGVIRLFLEMMQLHEQGVGNLQHEVVLGNGDRRGVLLGQDASERPVYLSGKVDRVDAARDHPKRLTLGDYKTGGAPDPRHVQEKTRDGRMLQLPLYAAGLQIQDSAVQVEAGFYMHLTDKAPGKAPGAGKLLVPVATQAEPGAEPRFDPEAARQLALKLASEIRAGVFSLTDHTSGDTCECTDRCELRHACRQPNGYQ